MKFEMPQITPEFIVSVAIRRRWIIMLPFSAALVVGIYLALTLPKVYEAKTLILIESQRVPQNYVQSIVTEDPAERINSISQQINSRTNLEKIINDFRLFAEPKAQQIYMEDKIESLRKRISVDVITSANRRETEAFSISFKGEDPQKVMQVANGLANYFIDANLKSRESQAIGTSDFLESELETIRLKLEGLEEKIKNYRKINMGELPEQLESNLRILDRLQEDLNDRQQNLRDAKLRLVDLKTQATNREPAVVVIRGEQGRGQGEGTTLAELKAQLETLRGRYTEKHPDIQRLKKQISDLEAKANSATGEGDKETSLIQIPVELRQQIADVEREIQTTEAEIADLRNQIATYQHRIENTPKREQELLELRRDYENIQTTYESLLNRKLEADIAVNMERKQKGEQFRIVDPARVPQRPIEPDLRKMFLFFVAVGLSIGFGMALLLEIAKPTYRSPEELESECEMTVLTSIPRLLKRKQIILKWINLFVSFAFCLFILGLVAAFGYLSILKA